MRIAPPRLTSAVALAGALLCSTAHPARADITAFVGSFTTPASQPVRGVAVGLKILVIGVELEYANAPADTEASHPSMQEGSAALVAETPTGRFKVYGLLGAGLYRERFGEAESSTNTSLHVGGGLKIGLFGPVGLRLDYRLITLNGRTVDRQRQRFYAGLRLDF